MKKVDENKYAFFKRNNKTVYISDEDLKKIWKLTTYGNEIQISKILKKGLALYYKEVIDCE